MQENALEGSRNGTSPASPCHCALQGAPRRPFIGYPPPGMYMGYGMDMGPYRGRGRGPMPMQPGRFAQPAYGYGYGYGYFPPPYAQPFPGRMPQGVQMGGGRGFIGERRPPPGTPGVSSGLQVVCCYCCTVAAHAALHCTWKRQIINACTATAQQALAQAAAYFMASMAQEQLHAELLACVHMERQAMSVTMWDEVLTMQPDLTTHCWVQVVVHNLPWNTTWQQLKDAFVDTGMIERADVIIDSSGRSR